METRERPRARRSFRFFPRVAAASGLAVLLPMAASPVAPPGTKVIYETRSKYSHIYVREDGEGRRYLMFSETGGYQSVRKYGETDQLELPYSKVMLSGLACVEDPRRMLVVGLGGGSIPSFIHARYPRLRIDCVEIDPSVIDVAKRFFGFREDDRLRAYAADGRKFIEESRVVYDVIFLDAYGDDFIPIHLATREFLRLAHRILSPKGILVGNLWGRSSNELYDSMVRTYLDVFPDIYLLNVPARSNVILLAFPRPTKLSREDLARAAARVAESRKFGYDLADMVRSSLRDDLDLDPDAEPLADDKAGVGGK